MLRNIARFSGPVALIVLPKCPLCLLPLAAALGIAIPSFALTIAAAAVAMVWLCILGRRRVTMLAAAGAARAIVGRAAGMPWLIAIGVLVMIAAAYRAAAASSTYGTTSKLRTYSSCTCSISESDSGG